MTTNITLDINNLDYSTQQLTPENPSFAIYEPGLESIQEAAEQHEFNNLIVIANGGSITSFRAYLEALPGQVENVHLVTTMEPGYLKRTADNCSPENTLVMPISKSGETVGVIEALLYFIERDYDVFAVTSDNNGALRQIVERNGYSWLPHPDVPGRFSGATETGLVPSAFAGLDFKKIRKGAEQFYSQALGEEKDPALRLASALHQAEKNGHTEIFAPFYSTRLFGHYPFLVQMMHETVCKQGKGQTLYGDLGPECQHHTIQRLFGGRKNIFTSFFRVKNQKNASIHVPGSLKDIGIRSRTLADFDGYSLARSLDAEYRGVKDTLDENNMPHSILTVERVTPEAVGELLAFIQFLAYYSARLRDLDPFQQPDVERSKQLGFESRF